MRGFLRFFERGPNLLGFLLVLFFAGVAVAAPVLAPLDEQPEPGVPPWLHRVGNPIDRIPHPPSADASFGTLPGQWDVFHTLVWGAQTALRFGLTAALGAAALGTLIGVLSGAAGGWAYRLAMTVTDGFLTFPVLAGYILIEHVMVPATIRLPTPVREFIPEHLDLDPLVLTFILFSWMPYARIISANALKVKQVDFVNASRALGATSSRVVFHHILPNVVSPAIVLAARDVGGMVILSAAFTFIGVGSSSPWGSLIVLGRDWIIGPGGNPFIFWWIYIPAALALLFFGIGWNLVGDGLSDLLLIRRQNGITVEAKRGRPRGTLAVPASAVALGIIVGILWAWWASPPRPSDLTPEALREEHRAEYLRMSIELFSRDLDIDKAMRRYQSLGRQADDTLDLMLRVTTNPPQRYVRQFTMVAREVAALYPVQTGPVSPPGSRILIALVPVGTVFVFVLSAPAALRHLARRPGRASRPETIIPAAKAPRLKRF